MAVSLGAKGTPGWTWGSRGDAPEVRLQRALKATPGSWASLEDSEEPGELSRWDNRIRLVL